MSGGYISFPVYKPINKHPLRSDWVRSSFRNRFPSPNNMVLRDMQAFRRTEDMTTFAFQIFVACLHSEGVYVSGGLWIASIWNDYQGSVGMTYALNQNSRIQYTGVPYRPSALPWDLYVLTPEGSFESDPFGGAANWIPFQ